jgi:3-oxoacyl-[acyl-carrier-protein] synthase-3
MAQHWMLTEPKPGAAHSLYDARIEAIGVKLPERRLTTAELMASTRHHTHIDLERLTGIRERRICSDGEDSFTLARDAAKDCLTRSHSRADDLEMVICTSITHYEGSSHRFEPPLSLSIKEAIGAHTAINFDISNACAGMMTGIFVLNDFIRRGAIRRGLVVSGECISGLGKNAAEDIRGIYSRQLASLTLGDAGAAVIVERAPPDNAGIIVAGFTTISEHSRLCLGFPAPHKPGAKMLTKARTIHKAAMQDAPPLLEDVFADSGLKLADIDWLIPHQTSARALRAGEHELAVRFGAHAKHLVVNCEDFGNTASTTHFVALHRLLTEKRIHEGDKVMLLALASGLEIGVIVFAMDQLSETHGRPH